MSTHYIEEAERLADTVTIMSHGKAVARRPAGRARARARGRARCSRSTARRRGWPRSSARRPRPRLRTRRTGTAVAILRAEGATATLPEGERRAGNLEDVFVLLTGEEIE